MNEQEADHQDECERCKGSGIIGLHKRSLTYAGAGPVPEDARRFIEADCDRCGGTGFSSEMINDSPTEAQDE